MVIFKMKERIWEIDWDYWEAQIEGYNALKKKKKLWRDHKNENKEIVDSIYEWFWNGEEE
tara:strand:- start:537 stop:716 length:180 start_codon:yes stop_codon:yes gene_type:complete